MGFFRGFFFCFKKGWIGSPNFAGFSLLGKIFLKTKQIKKGGELGGKTGGKTSRGGSLKLLKFSGGGPFFS